MDILFGDDGLERLCREERRMNRKLGTRGARKLRARIKDLRAAESMTEIRYGRPHPLRGRFNGCIGLDLDGGRRLVVEAADDPVPLREDGGIDWSLVTMVRIVFIGDYHD
jgi:proteic killer suppression protein